MWARTLVTSTDTHGAEGEALCLYLSVRVRLSREARLPPAIPLRANEVSVRGLIIMIHADTNPGPGRGGVAAAPAAQGV